MPEKPRGEPEPDSAEANAPTKACEFENCNRLAGHHGPHGFEAEPGLIFAPYGGGEGRKLEPVPVALKCDSCHWPVMRMQRYEAGGATFACEACNQQWSFAPDGRVSCTVIAQLYPSKMDEDSALYQEFLAYRLKQCRFELEASLLCGALKKQEADRLMTAFEIQVADKRREIAARVPWWRRVFSRSVSNASKPTRNASTGSKEKD
jgi:hypothetical protein